jgi:ubiquitin carboxyl-terminal hydrolase 34
MYHEATACHVSGDLLELLAILLDLMKCLRMYRENKDVRGVLLGTKEWVEVLRKLATLLNTYNSSEMRASCIGKYNILLFPLFELSSFHFT